MQIIFYTKLANGLIAGSQLKKESKEVNLALTKKIELVNYPNPFNPGTVIKYSVLNKGEINLSIYNILGEKVIELVNGEKESGEYSLYVDMRKYSTGVYIYRLVTPDYVLSKKMLLIK